MVVSFQYTWRKRYSPLSVVGDAVVNEAVTLLAVDVESVTGPEPVTMPLVISVALDPVALDDLHTRNVNVPTAPAVDEMIDSAMDHAPAAKVPL